MFLNVIISKKQPKIKFWAVNLVFNEQLLKYLLFCKMLQLLNLQSEEILGIVEGDQ